MSQYAIILVGHHLALSWYQMKCRINFRQNRQGDHPPWSIISTEAIIDYGDIPSITNTARWAPRFTQLERCPRTTQFVRGCHRNRDSNCNGRFDVPSTGIVRVCASDQKLRSRKYEENGMEWCLPLFEMPLGLIQLPVYCQSHDEVTDFFSRMSCYWLFRTIIHKDELLRI